MLTMPAKTNLNGSQTLLIDADDTLWENNIYFERAIANFISFLNHREYSPAQVREVLNQVERESIMSHGYGLHSFAHSLVQTFERLAVEPITPALHEKINGFAHTIAGHPVEILPGVPETLQYLSERHHLILMTKGAIAGADRQGRTLRAKRVFLGGRDCVGERMSPLTGRSFPSTLCDPDASWMIGNSPKSDINPALAAGLNAVFVPHGDTWILEHEEVASAEPPRQLLVVEKFSELQTHSSANLAVRDVAGHAGTAGPSTPLAALRSGRDDRDLEVGI